MQTDLTSVAAAGSRAHADANRSSAAPSPGWGPLLTKHISRSADQDGNVHTRAPRCRTSVRHTLARLASIPPLTEGASLPAEQGSIVETRAPRCSTNTRHILSRHASAPLPPLTKCTSHSADKDTMEDSIVETRTPRCSTSARHTLARHANSPLHEGLTLDDFVGPALISVERLQRAAQQMGSETTTNFDLAALVLEHHLREGPRQLVQPHRLHTSSISRTTSTVSITRMSSEICSTPIEYSAIPRPRQLDLSK